MTDSTQLAPSTTGEYVPGAPYIKVNLTRGRPYIETLRCEACGSVFLKPHVACANCGDRSGLTPARADEFGVLQTFTVVSRSFPGVVVPFVSAIVRFDDGVVLKGNLIEIEPDPAVIKVGMRVRLIFGDANGQKDKDGNRYLAYFFKPAA